MKTAMQAATATVVSPLPLSARRIAVASPAAAPSHQLVE